SPPCQAATDSTSEATKGSAPAFTCSKRSSSRRRRATSTSGGGIRALTISTFSCDIARAVSRVGRVAITWCVPHDRRDDRRCCFPNRMLLKLLAEGRDQKSRVGRGARVVYEADL